VTFRDFCEAIGDGVLSCVPAARYQPPRELGDAATISLGGAKATISREKSGWRVAFVRSGGVTSMRRWRAGPSTQPRPKTSPDRSPVS